MASMDSKSGKTAPQRAIVRCILCNVDLPTEDQARSHYSGQKHLKNKAKLDNRLDESSLAPQVSNCDICGIDGFPSWDIANRHFTSEAHMKKAVYFQSLLKPVKQEAEKQAAEKNLLGWYCGVCDVKLESSSAADAHYAGKKHQSKLAASNQLHCNVCDLPLTSQAHADIHYAGKKHQAKVAAAGGGSSSTVARFHCDVCDLDLNSQAHADAHYSGRKHQAKAAAAAAGVAGPLHCHVCDIALNSQSHADQHYAGAKHKKKLANAGKPVTGHVAIPGEVKQETTPGDVKQKMEPNPGVKVNNLYLNSKSELTKHFSDAVEVKQEAGSSNDAVVTWFKSNKVVCGVCVAGFTSRESAEAHFDSQKHMAAVMSVSAEMNRQKYCPICKCELGGHAPAEAHFKGQQHRKKFELAKAEGLLDAKLLFEMDPENALTVAKKHIKVALPVSTETDRLKHCPLCECKFESLSTADAHYAGQQHQKKFQLARDAGILDAKLLVEMDPGNTEARILSHQAAVAKTHVNKAAMPMPKMDKKKYCPICEIKLDTATSISHYRGQQHRKKFLLAKADGILDVKLLAEMDPANSVSVQVREQRMQAHKEQLAATAPENVNRHKYCPICKCQLSSPATATAHYKGQQHRKKYKQCKDAGQLDAQLLAEMDPDNALFAAQQHMVATKRMKPLKPGAPGYEEEADGESPSKLRRGNFNCLFCKITLSTKQALDKHRSDPIHLANLQKQRQLQSPTKPAQVGADNSDPLNLGGQQGNRGPYEYGNISTPVRPSTPTYEDRNSATSHPFF